MNPREAAQHVSSLIQLLGSIYQSVSDKRSADRRGDLLLAHMLKVQSTASGILLLGQYYHVEEVAVLTRTLSEMVVNSCYLLVAEELEVDRFMKFDYVKGLGRT